MTTQANITIVTGLSGAGISSVLKTLEDMGFEVFDNFPVSLVHSLVNDTAAGQDLAIGIDSRSRGFDPDAVLEIVKETGAKLLFIACDDTALQRRYTETRRRHPLAQKKSVKAGIREERKMLGVLQDVADFTIDTTQLSIHDLKHILRQYFDVSGQEQLTVSLVSFGFKHGLPRAADIVMDVRFLVNPYWSPALREKTGKDPEVAAFIEGQGAFEPFLANFKALLGGLLPRYVEEGKSYLTVAIGCTGGQHRSVYTVEALKAWLESQGLHPYVEHRDLG